LLTGGRQKEVFGLEIADVDFYRKSITFRPNKWRRLKTKKSHRAPLAPTGAHPPALHVRTESAARGTPVSVLSAREGAQVD